MRRSLALLSLSACLVAGVAVAGPRSGTVGGKYTNTSGGTTTVAVVAQDEFTVQADKGRVTLKEDGQTYIAQVECTTISGNITYYAARIVKGTAAIGSYIMGAFADNGEPNTFDQISNVITDQQTALAACQEQTTSPTQILEQGNAQTRP